MRKGRKPTEFIRQVSTIGTCSSIPLGTSVGLSIGHQSLDISDLPCGPREPAGRVPDAEVRSAASCSCILC